MWPDDDTDQFGNPICAQSFMGGTICSLAPDHEGRCAPICQNCGNDWYLDECVCRDEEGEELTVVEDIPDRRSVRWW